MTLEALCRLEAAPDSFEVIVTDDGAIPPLDERLRPYRNRLPLRVLRLERMGPGAARNAAARVAASRLLIFLDDDCVPDPRWLKAYLQAHSEAADCALAGPILNGLPRDLYSEACHLIFGYLYSRHIVESGAHAPATRSPFVISANFGVSADLFRSVGEFDEEFQVAAEDRMFSEKWARSSHGFRAVPDAIVRHHRPLTLAGFLAQQFRYGRGGMIFRRAVHDRGWPRKPAESISFYRGLLFTAFRHPGRLRRLALFLLLALSQVAIAAGYAAESARSSGRFR